MERFSFPESVTEEILLAAQEIADKKIAAYEAAKSMSEILTVDGITPLLQLIVSNALPLI